MKESTKYVKIVEWSEDDQCFVRSCPGLVDGGCHGADEQNASHNIFLAPVRFDEAGLMASD